MKEEVKRQNILLPNEFVNIMNLFSWKTKDFLLMAYAGDFSTERSIEAITRLLSYRNDAKWWNMTTKSRFVLVLSVI